MSNFYFNEFLVVLRFFLVPETIFIVGIRFFVISDNLAILRAIILCIRGSLVPASKISKRVQFYDGAGLGLFETM
jgi:hypothetical protein